MCLVAHHLEEAGVPTVILGSALDIVEHCRAPRFVFTDFPLGNPCGRPYDADMQLAIVASGVALLESAERPGTVVRTPYDWGSDTWRKEYMELRPEDAEAMQSRGEARRTMRAGMRERRRG